MTLRKLIEVLQSTGLPVAHSHFDDTPDNPAPPPPFVCYVVSHSTNFFADGKVHAKIENVQVELYTDRKDPTAERLVEQALEQAGLSFDVTETYIESEKLFQRIYEVGVIVDGE